MEGKQANENAFGKQFYREEVESSEEIITYVLKDNQPSKTVFGDTSDKKPDCGSFEVTSVCGSTAENSAVSHTTEENLVESTASSAQEKIEENNINNSSNAGTKRDHCDTIELPSAVTDREEIFVPNGIDINDPRIYGKWMLFTYGDVNRLDRLWIQLQDLVSRGDVILLKSSTAKSGPDHDQSQGAIMCYTSEDKAAIKRAGVSIQDIVKEDIVLNYKTNEDSNKNVYRRFGSRFIAKYMLLAKGKLYKRDYLDRWKKVDDSPTENPSVGGSSGVCLPLSKRPKQGSELFPSRERKVQRYFYPKGTALSDGSGTWRFFCDAVHADSEGTTELDRMWHQTVALCEEGCFSSTSCETRAFQHREGGNYMRRSITCELKGYSDVNRVIQTGVKLRERTSYNHPLYFDVCFREPKKKLQYRLKYMYTEDGELYEHDSRSWKLLEINP